MNFTTLLSSLGAILFLRLLYRRFCGPLAHLPGPEISRWTGLPCIIYWFLGQKPNYVHYLHGKYGPIVRVSPEEVDICDIDATKEIHKTGGRFLKSAFYQTLTPPGTENVFSTTDPAFHAAHRRLLASPISDSSLAAFEPVIAGKVRLAVSRMAEEMRSHGSMDIFKWWLFMATDVIGELSFGESFRMLESGKKNQYILDLERTSSLAPVRTTFPSLVRLGSIVPLPLFQSVADAGKRIRGYAQQSVDRYNLLKEESGSGAKPTLFTKLYNAGREGLSNTEIRDEAQAYIVAGSDTTAVSLTYLVYAVCRDESIRRRLADEVNSLPEAFTDRMIRNLPYLNRVINEALRLHTAVPSGLPRSVPSEGADFLGFRLPGRVTVTTQAYSLHRMESIFPEPERFNPDRWETITKAMSEAFMPFGKGSRVCLGMHLARMELRLATALFFRAFPRAKVSTKEGMNDEDMRMKSYFLMTPSGHRCLIEA
ncbi:cytochrome P450 [Aspergillus alliaceus]|uniref:Cytochrome P450 n=1 Tax=Petromyces alliaceus TaxID=209559 RepID=A0A5N7CBG3_PETAA|nr:cytochrome P450 [Aspergillus alliaceus]